MFKTNKLITYQGTGSLFFPFVIKEFNGNRQLQSSGRPLVKLKANEIANKNTIIDFIFVFFNFIQLLLFLLFQSHNSPAYNRRIK